MNQLPAWAFLLLLSGPLSAQESSTRPAADAKDLPGLNKEVSTPEIKQSNLTKASDYIPAAPAPTSRQTPAYSKEQLEALNKSRNWAVEGLKDRREADKLEMEKLANEDNSLNNLLETERKSIDERMGKASSPMNQFKPSIETDWTSINKPGTPNAQKELAEKKRDLQTPGQSQGGWMQDSWNSSQGTRKESVQAFDPAFNNPAPFSKDQLPAGERNSLQNLQTQLEGTKSKNESNLDYLASTGQAQNFRKLSNDPNYQPPTPFKTGPQPSIDAVPSVPQAVTSTMNLETMRQIEQQRVNAIPKPDFKELNSRIPDPGSRRF